MHATGVEPKMLNNSDEHQPDDKPPDYAQSQAQMDAMKRMKAVARARDLEAWWRDSR
jgi:hypothetical protein